jgi:hypothetical protein
MDMEDEECSLRAFLSTSRTSGLPLRLPPREELLELCADLTRVQESNDISVGSQLNSSGVYSY